MDPVRDQLQQALVQTYRIDREIGGGGMSRVFLATEIALDRLVVLKVLPPELAGGVSVERFKREISLAARLQHAHIVPLLSTGDANGLPWFAMPFVDGASVRTRLGHGELPIADVVRTLRDVASALAYAHARGIVHRDIKPENILLADGGAVVTDFGVAKALLDAGDAQDNTLTSVGMALGTPAYMAPEQIAGDARTDHRADIYALGVVAYEMLGGHNPFAGRSPQATMAAHITEAPTPVERVRSATPPALAQLVHRCMAKSAADRPQSAQEIVNALDGLVTPTGTISSMRGRDVAYPSERAPSTRVAVIALGLIVLLSAAWFANGRTRGPELTARRVAVVPFTNLTGDPTLTVIGRVASEELSRSIAQTDSVEVVASSAVEVAASGVTPGSGEVVTRVATATGAAMIVVGSYTRFGDSLRMQARIEDARSGKVIRALDQSTGPLTDPMVAIAGLRERLLGSIVSGDLARKVSVATSPPNYRAYLEYLDGLREFVRDQTASRQYFERAIALDPRFVNAHVYLAATFANAGLYEEAEKVSTRLDGYRDELSSTDRMGVEYLRARLHGEPAQIARLAEELAKRTLDPHWSYLAAYWSLSTLRPAKTLEWLRQSDSLMVMYGWVGQLRDEAWAHHLLQDYGKELATLDRGIVRVPARATVYTFTKLRAYGGMRNVAAARSLADTVLNQLSERGSIDGLVAVDNGVAELAAHGDRAGAALLNRTAIEWAARNAPPRVSVAWERTVARLWFFAGELDSAAAHFARALPDTSVSRIGTVSYLAMIAARKGDTTRARAVSDSLAAQVPKWDRGLTPFWRAAIASELGDRDQAVRLLTMAAKQVQLMPGWHSTGPLRALHGFPAFDALIAPRD